MKELPTRAITRKGRKSFLSIKEEKALAIYVANNCDKIEEAMKAVGYAGAYARKVGYKLLKTKRAKEYLANKIDTALQVYNKKADDVLQEIALIAFSDPADMFVRSGPDGIAMKNILDMGPERRAIKKIKHTQRIVDIGGTPDENGEKPKLIENIYEYETWSKPDALKVLAQHHKIISDEQNNNTVVLPLLYLPNNKRDDEADRIY